MTTKVYKIFLAISIACFALSSVSVMLILADNIKESLKPLIISTIFWGGLIIGLIFTFLIGKYRKNEKYKKSEKQIESVQTETVEKIKKIMMQLYSLKKSDIQIEVE